ncbi:MAG: NAD(P)/FAD-dependent oxidoreductase [Clostridia bacterium]|nr:NAD(P)/FAD-dependent oxidoreductase [Clostridia bacterium]
MKTAIIGGGPAGMMAAIAASEKSQVTLYEKNDILGKKLLITGKGRCNLTNAGTEDEIIEAFGKNGRFLFSALNSFSNKDLMNFFEKRGLPLKVERGKRVFPESDKSLDVIRVLEKELNEKNIKILKNTSVKKINVLENNGFEIVTEKGNETYDALVITTGGKSYPKTGSTGDGYIFARSLGHSVSSLSPYLIPLETNQEDIKELMGLSLKNVLLKAFVNGKKKGEEFGEMIFTHFGISGPVVLTLSKIAVDALKKEKNKVVYYIDFKPALSFDELDKRIIRDFEKYNNKQFKNALDDLLPRKMIPVVLNRSGIDEEKKVNQISKEERKIIIDLLKDFPVEISGTRPLSEAIVTSGGISLKEINPKTMESKLYPGLFFAGEILDLDGVTGGYNLQEAFSTGFLAGSSV